MRKYIESDTKRLRERMIMKEMKGEEEEKHEYSDEGEKEGKKRWTYWRKSVKVP